MFVKVKNVEANGALLTILDKARENEEVWLPREEWSNNPQEWYDVYDALEIDQELCVVALRPTGGPNGQPVVSRKRFKRGDVDESWEYRHQIMRVDSISSRDFIRGHIGVVPAVMKREKYLNFLNKNRLGPRLMDHAALAKGDMLGGVVMSIAGDSVELDPEQYLDALEEELSQEKPDSQHVEDEYEPEDMPPSLDEETAETISPVLLLENDESCLNIIKSLLTEGRAKVKTARSSSETEKLLEDVELGVASTFRMAIIDPNLGREGIDLKGMPIARDLTTTMPECRIILITGEGNERKAAKWSNLKLHSFLPKPFTMEELLETIDDALRVEPKTLSELIEMEENKKTPKPQPSPLDEKVKDPKIAMRQALQELASVQPGTVVHVFELHPRSFRAKSLAHFGEGLQWEKFRGKIGKSRIKDTVLSDQLIIETVSPNNKRLHLWTIEMMNYNSFCGIPIKVLESVNKYALVAFHQEKDAFDDKFKFSAILCVEKVARALERKKLLEIRQNEATFIATGMGLESLGHELYTDLTTPEGQTTLLQNFLNKIDSLSIENREKVNEFIGKIRSKMKEIIGKTKALRGVRSQRDLVSVGHCLYRAAISCRKITPDLISRPELISIVLPPEKPENDCKVKVAPASLIIVFFNLYLNAAQQIYLMRQVRKTGRVWHSLETREDENGKPWAVVRIHDTGPGIHPEDWERIFEPGYTTKPEGMGFGLYICRHLLDSISESGRSAEVKVTRSVLWDGTTFTVKLPLPT